MARTPKVPDSTAGGRKLSSDRPVRSSASSRKKPKKSAGEQLPANQVQTPAPTIKPVPRRGQSKTPPPDPSAAANTANAELGPNGYPLYSTSKLAEMFESDRSVVRRRLQAAKIKPVDKKEKKTIYELTPEVEELLSESGDPRLDDLKYRELEAKARLKEMEVDKKTGRLVDMDEAVDVFGKAIKGLYDRLKVDYPPKAGPRLFKLKSGREVTLALKRDFDKIFGEFRSDFRRFLR